MANPLESLIDSQMLASNGAPAQAQPAQRIDPVANAIDEEMREAKYGTLSQEVLTGVEGLAKGLAGPLATGAEALLHKAGVPGLSPEEQAGRAETNPYLHGTAEVAGFIAPALATAGASAAARAGLAVPEAISMGAKAAAKYSQAGLLEKAGKAAEPIAAAFGIGGPGAGVFAKIGSSAVRGAVENGLYQVGDETSRLINADPNQSVQTAIAHVGLASLVGGGLGGGIGTVSALWRATLGSKSGAILNSISDKVGGIEEVASNMVDDIISRSGIEIAPEIQAALKNDPAVREMFHTLIQSSTTNSGRVAQQSLKDFNQKVAETLSEALGRLAKNIPEDFDKYTHGMAIGNTLADEASERVGPLKKAYEDYRDKFKGKELVPSIEARSVESQKLLTAAENNLTKATKVALRAQKAGNPEAAIEAAALVDEAQAAVNAARTSVHTPGTVDMLQDRIARLANDEKWVLAPDDEIMKAVGSILRELPQLKTLSDVSAYIKRIEEKLPFDPFKGARNRAAGMLKGVLRDTEGELIGSHIGSEAGAEALGAYRLTQKAYGAESKIREALESRLGKLGSTASYAKTLREMASTDGESMFRKLSGKDDADILRILQQHFPKTAQALREAHVDQILTKARDGEALQPNRIMTSLGKLSPQLRGFVVPPGSSSRVEAIGSILNKLKDPHYNYSGTGRSIDRLFQYVPGTAVGLVSMLLGHNPATSLVLGALTKYVSKEAPDAVRLGLLKWLGSNKPIEAGAFKSMVDFIHNTMKGDDMMSKATKNLISGASKVIPEHLVPSDRSLDELDKKIKKIEGNPASLEGVSQHAGYYMPDHGIAMTSTATNAVGYLSSLRPSTFRQSPLDEEVEPSESDQAAFRRVLMIAQQPLTITTLLKDGTLTTEDVDHLRNLYPEFYSRLSQKMTDALVSHVAKGETVPYELRMGISTLIGQPMDSSLEPTNIMNNQMAFAQSAQQEAAEQGGGGIKPTSKGMREMKSANRLSLDRDSEDA